MTSVAQWLKDGIVFHHAGNLTAAAEHYSKVLAFRPRHADAWHLLGVARAQGGHAVEGLAHIGRALAAKPTHAEARENFDRLLPEAHAALLRDRAAGAVGPFMAGCVAVFLACAERYAGFLLPSFFPLDSDEAFVLKPLFLDASLDAAGAVRDGADVPARMFLGVAAALRQDVAEAERLFRSAAALAQAEVSQAYAAALALYHYKRYTAAIDAASRAVVLEPENGDAWHLLGKALYQYGRCSDGERVLRRCLALDPGNATTRVNLATVLHEQDRFEAALDAFRTVLGQDDRLPLAHLGLGTTLFALGRRDEALRAFRCALEAGGAMIEAHVGIGSALIDSDPVAAMEAFVKAINLKIGLHLSPAPRAPGIYEAMRGYSDAVHRHLRGKPRQESDAVGNVGRYNGETYAEARIQVGHTGNPGHLPLDDAFHPLDASGRIETRRVAPPLSLPLAPPLNYEAGFHDKHFYRNTYMGWLQQAYKRFAWTERLAFPQHFGCDGVFLSHLHDPRFFDGYLFTGAGDFFEESALFDELVLFGAGQKNGGLHNVQNDFRLLMLWPPTRIAAPHAMLSGYHMINYACWLMQAAPKILYFQQLAETRGLPLAMDRRVFEAKRFIRETLEILDVRSDDVLLLGNGSFAFKSAFCVTSGAHMLSLNGARLLRERFLDVCVGPARKPGGRAFYISRRGADVRRILNEEALIALLERHGVTVVDNMNLSMQEIVALFADARCVIGGNGAGMANILFCPAGTHVVEICTDVLVEPIYWVLSNALGLNYWNVVEPALNKKADIVVSLPRVEAILEQIL